MADRTYLIETSASDRRPAPEIRRALSKIGVSVDPSYETTVGLGEASTLLLRGKAADDVAEKLTEAGFHVFPELEVSAYDHNVTSTAFQPESGKRSQP